MTDVAQPFWGCTHHKTAAADIIQWSNWDVRKGRTQWLSLLGMGIGLVMVTLAAYMMLSAWGRPLWEAWQVGEFAPTLLWRVLALVVGGVLLVGLSMAMLVNFAQLTHQQTIIISDQDVVLYDVGRFKTTKRQYAKVDVIGLIFTKPKSENERTAEPELILVTTATTAASTNQWQRSLRTHIPLASWVQSKDQQRLFNLLRETFVAHGWEMPIEAVTADK
ncbi:MAG: hypothetical protein KDE51_00885 [Anaerolineales bacterium]|nr:hypothetical protein [Anaerolineales bacterium]